MRFWRLLVLFFLLPCAAADGGPLPAIIPPGLQAGDRYQLIFVSARTRDAQSGDIADYDSFVNQDADNFQIGPSDFSVSGIPIHWHAIVSTLATNAKTTAPQTQPVFNLHGDLVANGGLTSYLYEPLVLSPVSWSPDGLNTPRNVFTGTNFTGIASTRPAGTASVTIGHSDDIGETWIAIAFGAAGALPATNHLSIYALSDVITVPEPSTISLLCLAAGILAIARPASRRFV